MALGFGPQPYIPPGPGKIPFRSWTANPLIDLSKIGPRVPNFGGQLMLNAGPPVTPMGQVAGMSAWNPGQLPLTQQLPRMGGVNVSSLYQKPGTMAQPLTRTLPKIGPGAGDVSELLAPKALNPAPVATPMGPIQPAQQLALPAGSPLPAPPAAAASPTLSGTFGAINAGSGSYIPQSLINAVPGEGRLASMTRSGLGSFGNMAGGLAVGIGAGYLNNQLAQSPYANTPLGRVGSEGLTATQYGGFLGPKMAVAAGLGGAVSQAGLEAGRGNTVLPVGDNIVAKSAAGGAQDLALGMGPLGGAYNAAKLVGNFVPEGLGDTFSEIRSNTLGKIPWIGGMFASEASSQPSEEQQAQADNARAEAANKYTPSNIYSTAFAMGIPAQDIEPIVQQFKSQVAYMKASPTQSAKQYDPTTGAVDQAKTDEAIATLKDAGYDVADDGSFTADDAYINQMAWNQAYQSLPQVQQKSIATAEFARRNAALQSEIAGLLPRITAGMDPQMQSAVTAQMLQMPQYTAQMEQADALKSMTAQVLQQRQYAALQAAGLLPQSQSSGSSSSSADAIAAALAG